MVDPPSSPAPSEVKAAGSPRSGTEDSVKFAAKLLTFCLLAALLYWGRVVAIPLSLAILLSFTLKPLVRLLQRWCLPRALAVIITVTFACGVLGGFGWVIGSQLAELSRDLPEYRENISAKIRTVRGMMRGGTVEKLQGTMKTLAAELENEKPTTPEPVPPDIHQRTETESTNAVPVYLVSPKRLFNVEALAALLPIVDPLTTAALVLILVVLILLRWDDLRSRIISFSGHQNLSTATRACDDAGHRISRYLLLQLLLNGSYGLIFAVGLYFIGVPYAALWGLCAGLFRYLPYVGPVIGGVLPVLFTLITSDGWSQPLWVGGLILVMELVSNNVLEPWLYGSQLGLSEVGLIVAAVAWTFLWGPVGLLLATPLTVCLVVLGQYIPAFSIFSRLLSDMPVLAPHYRLYQRLLADDTMEATEIARKAVAEEDVPKVIDGLFVPALALADRDQVGGLLNEQVQERIEESLKDMFDKLTDETADASREATDDVAIVVWPISPMAASAIPWLRWLMRDVDCEIAPLSYETLSAEAAAQAQEKRTAAFCLIGLAEATALRERQLAKRLSSLAPGVPIVIARLGMEEDSAEAADPVDLPNADVTSARSLAKVCSALRPLVQQAILNDSEEGRAESN